MTREDDPRSPSEHEPELDEPGELTEDDAMSALLKRSLEPKEAASQPPKDLLRGVQKRIRTRSRGKFYADGWSTSSTRVNYMLVAAVMLIVIALAYFALGPMGITAH